MCAEKEPLEYHLPELAPTANVLDRYKKAKDGDWPLYERQFLDLMRSRRIERHVAGRQ
jgi:hypothetical protein